MVAAWQGRVADMCWSVGVTAVMVAAGAGATAVTLARRAPAIHTGTLGYFTLMEALQLAGYGVIDQCGTPANETVTLLSILHIVFQPLVINALALSLIGAGAAMRAAVLGLAGLSAVVMLLQLYPFDWAGPCMPGSNLCAERLCTVSGDWHLAWDVPYNGMMTGVDAALGTHFGFPVYMVAVFGLPLIYGAWRFAIFHLLAGPVLASFLTSNPNEVPAIWCLSSIAITLVVLLPWFRRPFLRGPAAAA